MKLKIQYDSSKVINLFRIYIKFAFHNSDELAPTIIEFKESRLKDPLFMDDLEELLRVLGAGEIDDQSRGGIDSFAEFEAHYGEKITKFLKLNYAHNLLVSSPQTLFDELKFTFPIENDGWYASIEASRLTYFGPDGCEYPVLVEF